MKEFTPFKGRICQWNGAEVYIAEKRELNKQINMLIEIQGGLGQTSQGHDEDWEQHAKLMMEERRLAESIHNALGL